VDRDGRFLHDGTQICFGFGRYRGHSLETVARSDPAYLHWMLGVGFAADTTQFVRSALDAAESVHAAPDFSSRGSCALSAR
jgi:hypothetical protein